MSFLVPHKRKSQKTLSIAWSVLRRYLFSVDIVVLHFQSGQYMKKAIVIHRFAGVVAILVASILFAQLLELKAESSEETIADGLST